MRRSLAQLLRPYVCDACRAAKPASSANVTQVLLRHSSRQISTGSRLASVASTQDAKFVEKRTKELGGPDALATYFPRWSSSAEHQVVSASAIRAKFDNLKPGETENNQFIRLYGRLTSRRKSSSTLWFLDVESGNATVQVLLNSNLLRQHSPSLDEELIRSVRATIRRGDWLVVTGVPHRTPSGELSLQATSLPQIVAPSLQPIPEKVTDASFISRNRHVDRILHSSSRDVLILRHKLIAALRRFLTDRDYVEVNTPLLVAEAGGAVARPFETYATEFRETKLNLRVAPELFLKRLIVGNMDKVFEIGTAFRNEGVDPTHNPEFSICEFYQVMTSLPELIEMTEELFHALASVAEDLQSTLKSIPDPQILHFKGPYKQLDFISALEHAIRQQLPSWHFPDLRTSDGTEQIIATFKALSIELQTEPNLPRLLDELAGKFLESQCDTPTWIVNHPECMSPLAKSFNAEPSSASGIVHRVSARAELFINGREYVNCYEEENSPLEQRRKFAEQIGFKKASVSSHATGKDDAPQETHGVVDESYIGALEYGMPPTGGWGCGIDRIVMLFSGKSRIADVLPFGTLTNVVALSTGRRKIA